jgi:hypothetical protein
LRRAASGTGAGAENTRFGAAEVFGISVAWNRSNRGS